MIGGSNPHDMPKYGLFEPGMAENFLTRGNPGHGLMGLDSPKIGAGYPADSPFSMNAALAEAVQSGLGHSLEAKQAIKTAPYATPATVNLGASGYQKMVDYTIDVATSAGEERALLLQQLSGFYQSQSPDNKCKEAGLVSTLLEALAFEVHQATLARGHISTLEAQHHTLEASHGRLRFAYSQACHLRNDTIQDYNALLVSTNQWRAAYGQLDAAYKQLEEQNEAAEEEARKEQEQADQREEGYKQQLADAAAQKAQLLETLCAWKKRATTLEQMGWQCGAWEFAAGEVARAKSGPPLPIEWPQEPEDKVVVNSLTVEEICPAVVPQELSMEVFDTEVTEEKTTPDNLSPEEGDIEVVDSVHMEICPLLTEEARTLAVNQDLPQLPISDIELPILSDPLSQASTIHIREGAGESTTPGWWRKAKKAFKKAVPKHITASTTTATISVATAATANISMATATTPSGTHFAKAKTAGKKAKRALRKLGQVFLKRSQ